MERIDDLQRNGLKLVQDTELFCFGTDAVLLADFVEIAAGTKVADLGTGTGILPLLLYGRQPEAAYAAVEIQPQLYALAQRSVALNNLEDNICIVQGDIAHAKTLLGENFDVVVSNPPYEKIQDGKSRRNESHAIARKEQLIDFSGLCKSVAALLRVGGKFYFIHKASRLPELICTLKQYGLEPKILRMVHAHITDEPKYVLLCAVKGAKEHLRVRPPLVMYEALGRETEEHRRIYSNDNVGTENKKTKGET